MEEVQTPNYLASFRRSAATATSPIANMAKVVPPSGTATIGPAGPDRTGGPTLNVVASADATENSAASAKIASGILFISCSR